MSVAQPPDLRDCVRAMAEVQKALAPTILDDLNLAGENWWLLLRNDFFRAFTSRRSAIYRKLFRTSSHTDPEGSHHARKDQEDLNRGAAGPWQFAERRGVHVLSRDAHALQVEGKGVSWVHYGLYRDHNERVDGRLFNRIADSWLAELGLLEHSVKLCPFEPEADRQTFWKEPLWLVPPGFDRSKVWWEPEEERTFRATLAELVEFCRSRALPFIGDVDTTLWRIRQCLTQAAAWQYVLEGIAPRFLALSSFYTEDRLPVLIAARRLRIPVCDLEHGFMGPYSPYAALGSLPQRALSLLPAAFWCWGEHSAAFLNGSLTGVADRTCPVVGSWGSPWHSFSTALAEPGLSRRSWRQRLFFLRAKRYRRRLLIVHQPDLQAHGNFPQLLPDHLWQVMREADRSTLWLLRLHPRSRHLRGTFEEAFRTNGIRHFEVEMATSLPLDHLRAITDGVLTSFSTIALEFHTQGIPFYLIDGFGVAMMDEFVKPPYCFAADTADKLRKALETTAPTKPRAFSFYHAIGDGERSRRDLEAAMEG